MSLPGFGQQLIGIFESTKNLLDMLLIGIAGNNLLGGPVEMVGYLCFVRLGKGVRWCNNRPPHNTLLQQRNNAVVRLEILCVHLPCEEFI